MTTQTQTNESLHKVREREQSELPQVLRLYARLSREVGEPIIQSPDLLDSKCFVAEAQGRIVGFCLIKEVDIQGRLFTQGQCLYVEPEFRHTALSRDLYRKTRQYARGRRLCILILADTTKVAQWQKAGYKPWKVLMTRQP